MTGLSGELMRERRQPALEAVERPSTGTSIVCPVKAIGGRGVFLLREVSVRTGSREQSEPVTEDSPDVLRGRNRYRDDEPLVRRRALAGVKRVTHSVVRVRRAQRRLVLIFGCQRSGTTMLQQTVLDRSWRVLIVEEHDSRLVGRHPQPGETVWQDYPTVLKRLHRVPFEVVAAKPLVESDRAVELMDAADPVKAIWMLRHYDAVARSNVERFGMENPYRDLQPFCDDDPLDWRCRGANTKTRETVLNVMKGGLSPLDAAAMFWWARNQLYFQQRLDSDGRIRIIRYDRLCNRPEEVVEALSDYIEIALPQTSIAAKIRPRPDSRGVTDLHPEVERLCRNSWESFAGCPEL